MIHNQRVFNHVWRVAAGLVLGLTLAAGCRHLESPTTPPSEGTVTTTIAGQVIDEFGKPIVGVNVTVSGTTKTTDANGLFAFPNISVGASRTFVIAKKPSYFNAAKAEAPTPNGVTYMKLMMATSSSIGTVNAATGGTLSMPSGATISLAAGGVVTSSGAPYSGTVTVNARHLDPAYQNFAMLFAGDRTGQRTDGSQSDMQTYGVIIAELVGSNGELLQPATGKPATLSLPISSGMIANAPSSIPLWYFDESLGMWKEEGSATRSGNSFVGNVQHFSFWNYDMSCDWAWVTGQIVCNDVPIPGVVVNLDAYVEGGLPMVITDGDGRFRVRVPPIGSRGQAVLQVLAAENNGLYWTNTPMPVNVAAHSTTDLGQIALSSPCPSYIVGSLKDCNGQLTPGMITANWPGGMSYVYTNTGSYKMVAPAGTALSLAATAASGEVAQPQQMIAGNQGTQVTAPDVIACNGTSSDVLLDINGSYDASVLAFSPDGSKLAVRDGNSTDLDFIDVASGNRISSIAGVFPSKAAVWLQFSPDGSRIVVYSGANYKLGAYFSSAIDCWTVSGTRLTSQSLKGAQHAVFSEDGSSLIASNENSTYVYDIASGQTTKTFSVPNYGQSVVGLMPGGSQFVVYSQGYTKTTAYIWDIASNQATSSFDLGSTAGNFDSVQTGPLSMISTDGKILAVPGQASMHFYNLMNGKQISTSSIALPYNTSYGIADDTHFLGQYNAGALSTIGLYNMVDGISTRTFDAPTTAVASGVAMNADGTKAAAVYSNAIRIWKVK